MKKLFGLFLVLFLLTVGNVYALPMTAKLSWTAPTATVDGQPLNADTAITDYKIYCGKSSGSYTVTKNTGSNVVEYNVADIPLTVGSWFCVITAINKYGESAFSNEKTFALDGAVPSAPLNLTIK